MAVAIAGDLWTANGDESQMLWAQGEEKRLRACERARL
jgi:hypothetical protein